MTLYPFIRALVEGTHDTLTWLLVSAEAATLVGGNSVVLVDGTGVGLIGMTLTVTEEETEPEALEAVSVYVVVAVGETETEPVADATTPGLGVILSEVALLELQNKVAV